MSDDVEIKKLQGAEFSERASDTLQSVNQELEEITRRVEAGEPVSEEELEIVAIRTVEALEALRNELQTVVGPIDEETLLATMREQMNPVEFQEYLEDREELKKYRADMEARKQTRESRENG